MAENQQAQPLNQRIQVQIVEPIVRTQFTDLLLSFVNYVRQYQQIDLRPFANLVFCYQQDYYWTEIFQNLFFIFIASYGCIYRKFQIPFFAIYWMVFYLIKNFLKFKYQGKSQLVSHLLKVINNNFIMFLWANMVFYYGQATIFHYIFLEVNIKVYFPVIICPTCRFILLICRCIRRFTTLLEQINKNKIVTQFLHDLESKPQKHNLNKNNTCAICLSEDVQLKLPCNHQFHKYCLQKWIKSNDTCPMCRKKLFENQA